MLMSAFALTIAPATAAEACRGPIVLNSMPLISTANGQSSFSWGYVQLWWNDCNGTNYGRVVSHLAGTSREVDFVYNNASPPATNQGFMNFSSSDHDPYAYQGPAIYSPNNAAGTFGEVFVGTNNIFYYAETDQSGANCQADYDPEGCVF